MLIKFSPITVNPCDKALGHASYNLKVTTPKRIIFVKISTTVNDQALKITDQLRYPYPGAVSGHGLKLVDAFSCMAQGFIARVYGNFFK